MHQFQYDLEKNLCNLYEDLNKGAYRHGPYRKFTVCDNKRREISVSSIRDRLVHRLIYDYLVFIWDKTFIYDAWSCRKGKGLLAAIKRTQSLLKSHPRAFIWRADIRKFFDNVDQKTLLRFIERRIHDCCGTLKIIIAVLQSYSASSEGIGMPIGNLTSQIFSNIYLNELDHFVSHELRPSAYLRYGDDFLLLEMDLKNLEAMRNKVAAFLSNELKLSLNPKHDLIVKARHGLKFLGVELWPSGRRLSKRNKARIGVRLSLENVASYNGVISKHGGPKLEKWLDWKLHKLVS